MLAKIISLFLILFFNAACAADKEAVITIVADGDETYQAQLEQLLPVPEPVCQVTFKADIYLQSQEFFYLIDIKVGQCVSHQELVKAVQYLLKKQKFETIDLRVMHDQKGLCIHFDLYSFWTFKKLKFKGIFVGKEHYRQYYVMDYGDRFDLKKHDASVAKLLEVLNMEGYFAARIQEELVYDHTVKSVTACLRLQRGSRFTIEHVDICFDAPLLNADTEVLLYEVLQKPFMQPLRNKYYHRDLINTQTDLLKNILVEQGYLYADIALHETVHPVTEAIDLVFKIYVHDRRKCIFVGNCFYTQAQLFGYIAAFGRSSYVLPASILAEEISNLYYDKGFWSVRVQTQEDEFAYYFTIDEGIRVVISDVVLRNLQHNNERYLVKKFCSSIIKRYYDAELTNKTIDEILSYFVAQGFWQSAFLHRSFELMSNNSYRLVLTFDEGLQHFLNKVHIKGFEHLEMHGPFKDICQQHKVIPFNHEVIEEQRVWLQNYFKKEGYYQPKIKPVYDKQGNNIAVTWQIDLDASQRTFGKTVLLGATTFPFSYVQRELAYAIGDQWHTDTVRHSISRLQKLEIFEAIQLFPDKDVELSRQRSMLLKLQLDDPFEIKARIGCGIQHVTKSLTTGGLTYRVGGSFIWKNPSNHADQLRLDADFTKAIRLVNAQYRLPWLFGLPISAMLQGYTNKFEYPGFIGSQKNLYTVVQQGCLLNVAGVNNNIDAALSTGLEVVDTFIDESKDNACFASQVARAINFQPKLFDKNIPFFLVQPTCILFFVDSTINPTRGYFAVLSAKGMFPLAKLAPSNFFIRILLEQSFFIPCSSFVFAIRLRAGHIFHPQFSTIIPIERFYLGGANSIRSYETDQCPPLGVVCDNGKELFVPQGGRSLANLNLELRVPLYNSFMGVIFGDVGALSNNRLADIRAKDLLSGIGLGIRYNTAIGPLRFDVAWRAHKRDGVGRPYAWFLSFGNAFI